MYFLIYCGSGSNEGGPGKELRMGEWEGEWRKGEKGRNCVGEVSLVCCGAR